jgi:hypothetical protein
MNFTWIKPIDYVPVVSLATFFASLRLERINVFLSVLALLAGLGYTITKWFFIIQRHRDESHSFLPEVDTED